MHVPIDIYRDQWRPQLSDIDPRYRSSFLGSERRIARYVARPMREFLETEVAGGVVLLVATVVALVWANSPLGETYESFWHTEIGIEIGGWSLREDLQHWVNDALMALFFFVVGLEVKREFVQGELADPRKAALPIAAALGGMIAPAILYLVFNAGGATHGWGIPMATDIAFALGVLALVAPGASPGLKVFLLSLAIVDDIGAIIVIALFYSGGISVTPLLIAALLIGGIVLLRKLNVWWMPVYVVLGVGVWLAVFESGVHATIAGVALGLLTPVRPLDPSLRRRIPLFEQEEDDDEPIGAAAAQDAKMRIVASTSVAEMLEYQLHPWTSYVIIPIFALANAGIVVTLDDLGDAATSPVALGVIVGLVVGKIVGITSFTFAALALKLGSLPMDMRRRDVLGLSALAGIGFTVSLFITQLAFKDPDLKDQAKIGILAASILATIVGAILLNRMKPIGSDPPPEVAEVTDEPRAPGPTTPSA